MSSLQGWFTAVMMSIVVVVGFSPAARADLDGDGDGVGDSQDVCPGTIPGVGVNARGCPAGVSGDFNRDGDVDGADLSLMSACWSGSGVAAIPSALCQNADFDFDTDVDMNDYGVFQRCTSGTSVPADPACAAPSAFVKDGVLYVYGTGADEEIALRLHAGLSSIVELDFGDDGFIELNFDRAAFTQIHVKAGGGDDRIRIDQFNGVFTDTELTTLDGGTGDDTLLGGSGPETFIGGFGNDLIDGNQGGDLALMGSGDDVFQWDPGDGSDTIEGQGGNDVLTFHASNANENISFSANGSRLQMTRDVASIVMDVDGVEQVDLRALGGTDVITINNLTGTLVEEVNINLASTLGGNAGDSAIDTVNVNGTSGADAFVVTGNNGAAEVTGVGALTRVINGEPGDRVVITGVGADTVAVNGSMGPDTLSLTGITSPAELLVFSSTFSLSVQPVSVVSLSLNGLGGTDSISSVGNVTTAAIPIIMDGGADNDTLLGSNANDLLIGGPGLDILDGNQGSDTLLGGDDGDIFNWDPGDGSDTIEGQGGNDVLAFNASNASEIIELLANGSRLRFTRNVASIVMDVDGVEQVDLRALGGTDAITVNSLAGTQVNQVNIELASTLGGNVGDNAEDTVTVNGTENPDVIAVNVVNSSVEVSGLAALIRIFRSEPALDTLIINGLAGVDTITPGPGIASLIMLTINQ